MTRLQVPENTLLYLSKLQIFLVASETTKDTVRSSPSRVSTSHYYHDDHHDDGVCADNSDDNGCITR